MEYIITSLNGNDRKIISRHDNLDEAIRAGKLSYEKLKCTISCISGTVNEDGKIEGKYQLYKTWF